MSIISRDFLTLISFAFGTPRKMAETGYDPRRSRVSEDTLNDFLRGKITGEITEVPGIGPAAAKRLAEGDDDDRVTNTWQLIGKFMMLKGPDDDEHKVGPGEHMQKFWHWLAEKEIKSHRSAIVKAIAEKMNQMMPGIYDADAYGSDSDDE
uniref:Uncharacterized protein n=1 Tax=Trieres chinensis TaxID=1514140 RepID=A0A7S1ZJR7_TRICV|mmetsp:Transcript_27029/g.55347  ORF Transcript_27029/g.55347 Transcript_27029/m.55347 type:complete len:151 (+) Transcript_27029:11-463(+)